MSNFTVNAIRDTKTNKGMMSTYYTCRSFVAYEDGEIILRGLSGTNEDATILVAPPNCTNPPSEANAYEKVFITNPSGSTIYHSTSHKR